MTANETLLPAAPKQGPATIAINFVPWFPRDSWYWAGVLFIRRDLPPAKILEIIAGHILQGTQEAGI